MALVKHEPFKWRNVLSPSKNSSVRACDKGTKTYLQSNQFVNGSGNLLYGKRVTLHNHGGQDSVTRIDKVELLYQPGPSNYSPRSSHYSDYVRDDSFGETGEFNVLTCFSPGEKAVLRNYYKDFPPPSKSQSADKMSLKTDHKHSSRSSHKSDKKTVTGKEGSKYQTTHQAFKEIIKKSVNIWFITAVLAVAAVIWGLKPFCVCQLSPLNAGLMESTLKSNVIGQEEAVLSLLLTFYKVSGLKSQPPVLLLTGSIGVGKSHVTDLIINNFPSTGHKQVMFYPVSSPDEVVQNLKCCDHNVIAVDGLQLTETHKIANWAEKVREKASKYRKHVWLLLVFTIEPWTINEYLMSEAQFGQEILRNAKKVEGIFNNYKINHQLIHFKPMEVHHIRECVIKELENVHASVSEDKLETILQELTSSPVQLRKGCQNIRRYLTQSKHIILPLQPSEEKIKQDEF